MVTFPGFDGFETDTLIEMMAGFLLVDHCYRISRRDMLQINDMLILLQKILNLFLLNNGELCL